MALDKTTAKDAERDIDIVALLKNVEFNPADVETAAAKNSVFFVEAIEYRLLCMEKRAAAKLAHERLEAEIELAIRKDFRDKDEKITENNIKALLILKPLVKRSADALAKLEAYDEYSKLIVDVFRMRRDCLDIVKAMQLNALSQQRAVEAAADKMMEARRKLRDKFPGNQ